MSLRATMRAPRWRALAVLFTASAMTLAACGGEKPFAKTEATTTTPAAVAATTPTVTTDEPAAAASTNPPDAAPSTAAGQPGSPAEAPSPAGVTPDSGSQSRRRPHTLSERVAADSTAKLNVRTMVSIIEGCHSGRDTYKACNTHAELGSPEQLGLTIGKRRGEVQISASDNGFRITGHSMSGGKFTVARGPNGDRFKCISGRMPGACPPDREWTW